MILTGDFILLRLSMSDFSFPMVVDLTLFLDTCSIFIFFSSTLACRPASRSCRAFRTSFKPKLSLFPRKDSANLKSLRAQAAAKARIRASEIKTELCTVNDYFLTYKKNQAMYGNCFNSSGTYSNLLFMSLISLSGVIVLIKYVMLLCF